MTKTALANKELNTKKSIERNKLLHDTDQQNMNRQLDWDKARLSASVKERGDKLNAGAKLGSSAIKAMSGLAMFNDPEFYKGYIRNLQDFVNIPTYDRLGNGKFISKLYSKHVLSDSGVLKSDVPGILTMYWIPSAGPQPDSTHFRYPINQTLARVKEKVLALNSRSSVNWEPSDLGYNLFCSADIMSAILELGRVIRVYQTYQSKNAYLARYLVESLGWSWTDITSKFAEYRRTYDLFARKFNSSIVVPANIGLLKRRAYLASNVFIDSEHSEYPRQMYAFVENARFILNDDGSSCTLLTTDIKSSISNFYLYVELMFQRITDNPDFSEMYQDLRHAFGSDLLTVPESMTDTTQVFNTVALNREQIHNLECIPTVNGSVAVRGNHVGFALRQDSSGYLYQGGTDASTGHEERKYSWTTVKGAYFATILTEFNDHRILNMHKEDVTGDDIIDITRSKCTYGITYTAADITVQIQSCGTEIVEYCSVWEYRSDDNTEGFKYYNISTLNYGVCSSLSAMQDNALRLFVIQGLLSSFDWCPIVTNVILNDKNEHIYCTFMDAYTTFTMSKSDIAHINEACVLGELYIPDSSFKSTFR